MDAEDRRKWISEIIQNDASDDQDLSMREIGDREALAAAKRALKADVESLRQDRAQIAGLELGIDRPGSDYKHFDTSSAYTCQNACRSEAMCSAFTYVRPGEQGVSGHCYLKNSIPNQLQREWCTSGIIKR